MWYKDEGEELTIHAAENDPDIACPIGPLVLWVCEHSALDDDANAGTYQPNDPGILIWWEWGVRAEKDGFLVQAGDDLAQGVSWTSKGHAISSVETVASFYLTSSERADRHEIGVENVKTTKEDLIAALRALDTIPQAYNDRGPEFVVAEMKRTIRMALDGQYAGVAPQGT